MRHRHSLVFIGLVAVSGCLYHVREETDRVVADITTHPYDLAPPDVTMSPSGDKPPGQPAGGIPENLPEPLPKPAGGPAGDKPLPSTRADDPAHPPMVQRVSAVEPAPTLAAPAPAAGGGTEPALRLRVPPDLPGSEVPPIKLPGDPEAKRKETQRLYPPLPPLPVAPAAQPGPGGKPYSLADLQRIAAENSPTLRQAASDVEAAKGNLIQARAYPNPTVTYQAQPSNDGSTAGVQGFGVDQTIKTGGKLKLQAAAAQVALDNAELALKRARTDLATAVRTAYFAVLVGRETVRINLALSQFTDQVYMIQAELLANGFAAAYEPAALRAQAYTNRLAYKQSIETYAYAWKQLVAAVGLRHLPLSEIEGRVDRMIPYFDYDTVLAHVLTNHTDVVAARNAVRQARYNLKLAQVTPVPDVDVNFAVLKETALPPFQWVHTVQIGVPIPVWDQNKGNIIAQEAALVRATEESHRVEQYWATQLATNYQIYKNNIDALEYYREFILPDQVRTFRGVYERRRIDPNSAFGDLVQAQQTLATNVQSYLAVLGQLWTSVVNVADPLQGDDLFQLASGAREVPPLPVLEDLLPLPCCHPGPNGCGCQTGCQTGCQGCAAGPGVHPGDASPGHATVVAMTPAGPAPVPPPARPMDGFPTLQPTPAAGRAVTAAGTGTVRRQESVTGLVPAGLPAPHFMPIGPGPASPPPPFTQPPVVTPPAPTPVSGPAPASGPAPVSAPAGRVSSADSSRPRSPYSPMEDPPASPAWGQ